jgi:hypothetical protein
MNLHEAPAFVAVKLATLSDGCAIATIKVDQLTARIADLRDRFNGRVIRGCAGAPAEIEPPACA